MNLEYFKNKDFVPLFLALQDKYVRTNKLVGTIKIKPDTDEQANKISRLIGKNIKVGIVNIIKIKDIEQAINSSKYEGITIQEILEYLYGNIITNKQAKELQENNKSQLLNDLLKYFEYYPIISWFKLNLEKNEEFYHKTMHILCSDKDVIYNILHALMHIPIMFLNSYENLSVFATQITKDPHYFDLDSKYGNYFIWYLALFLDLEYDKSRSTAIDILNKAGIYVDSFSNFVITYNFYGETYLNEMADRNEILLLNLDNILKLNNIHAKNKKVIVLENPSLMASLINIKTDCAFIITSGNPNIAMYKLLDKLMDHNLYYNGDYDPEGLLIADKLKFKYGSRLKFIGYDLVSFNNAVSNKDISDVRLKKLEKVISPELLTMKNELKKTRKSGYQEKNIQEITEYIEKIDN